MRNPLYYKVEAQKGILRSGFSEIIEVLPEARAFESILLDAIWVDPDSRIGGLGAVNNNHVYRSLEEAIEKEGDASIFILWKLREEVETLGTPSNKLREDIKVLYLDDLKFLMGKTDIRLTSGLDQDAEIDIFLLVKIFPEGIVDFDLKLDGQPGISFLEKSVVRPKENRSINTENNTVTMDKKHAITPHSATAFVDQDKIYVLWEHRNDQQYSGVRIFRSEAANIHDLDNRLGQEIYDGPGESNELECRSSKKEVEPINPPSTPKSRQFPNEPPRKPRKILNSSDLAPPTITGFTVSLSQQSTIVKIKADDDHFYHFYADNNVVSNKIYSYVLYAYDDNNVNSYPVVVNASISDISNNVGCSTVVNDKMKK